MKRIASLAALVTAGLLAGCAVYPDGTPAYGGAYEGYDPYAPGAVVVPQTSVYMGYSDYYGPGYYGGGPGRYYGPGPGYRGYPEHGRPNNGNHDDNGGHRGPPGGGPAPQGAVAGPRGPGGWSGPRPGAAAQPPAPPQPHQQAGGGGGGGRWNSGGGGAPQRSAGGRQPGDPTNH